MWCDISEKMDSDVAGISLHLSMIAIAMVSLIDEWDWKEQKPVMLQKRERK